MPFANTRAPLGFLVENQFLSSSEQKTAMEFVEWAKDQLGGGADAATEAAYEYAGVNTDVDAYDSEQHDDDADEDGW